MLEPAFALLLFGAWLVTGMNVDVSAALALVLYASAVALSRALPGVALGMAWAAVLSELTEQESQPVWFRAIAVVALLATLFGIASHGSRGLRWVAFASAFLWAPAAGYLLTVRGSLKFPQFGPVVAGYYTSQGIGLLLMSLLLVVLFVVVWLLGFLVSQQRATGGAGGSVLMWFASSGGTPQATDGSENAVLIRRLTTRQLVFDLGAAVGFFAVCLPTDFAMLPWEDDFRSAFVVVTVFAVAVALRRMSPALALATAWLAAMLQLTSGHSIMISNLAVLMVLYATAANGARVVRYAGIISAGVGAFVAALYLSLAEALAQGYFDLLSTALSSLALQFTFLFVVSATVLGLSWVLGLLMRTWRNARASRDAQQTAEIERNRAEHDVVVEQERTRIARDMHDVVAHSLAVVIAQADGARYARQSDPEAVDNALLTIASTARAALTDVRVLLAELRQSQPEGPQPTLEDLPQTVAQIRAAGLPVTFERQGNTDCLGSAQQIAAYRIVQEALTNALRHGDTTQPASVVLAEAADATSGVGVTITVRNSMKTPSPVPLSTGSLPRIGHGLPGMRERASLAGGALNAGPDGALFVVSAFLPVRAGVVS